MQVFIVNIQEGCSGLSSVKVLMSPYKNNNDNTNKCKLYKDTPEKASVNREELEPFPGMCYTDLQL
jgi:hypothetical protein